MKLEARLAKLEAAQPRDTDRIAHMTDAEVHARILELDRKSLADPHTTPEEQRLIERCVAVEAGVLDTGNPRREHLEFLRGEVGRREG
jgi:hypothetical protein